MTEVNYRYLVELDYIKEVICMKLRPQLQELCEIVVKDLNFRQGFGAKAHHHNYVGGLLIHTAEVLRNCLSVQLGDLERDVLVVSAIWHDYLKKRDYSFDEDRGIFKTEYADKIYHISGSWAEFYHQAKMLGIEDEFIDKVGHCILSHHGRPEWGSAITPKTREALVLHWADCMSAWFETGNYKDKPK